MQATLAHHTPKTKQAVRIAKFQTACEVLINLKPIACETHAYDYAVSRLIVPTALKKKSPSERKVSDGLYFQNQKPEKRVRACGTHPTHESKNHRTTVGCVAQATHAFGGWNGLCRLRWLNADSVRDVRDACVRLRRLWAACVPTALHSKRHPT